MDRYRALRRRVRLVMGLFIAGLVLSGLTALPIETEVDLLAELAGVEEGVSPDSYEGMTRWIARVNEGVHETNKRYPFLAYGTDWLAFAHFILAILFVGPLVNPVRNIWVIYFGMIACVLVIPMAMVFGPIRGIPFWWRVIDCGFGVFGIIPLLFAWKFTSEMAKIEASPQAV